MDLPEIGKQRKPAFTAGEVTTIISGAEEQFRTLYALLAGTGLRIEEAIGLQVEDIQCSVLYVRHSHWNGELYVPKTATGIPAVDLHSSLASMLRDHIGKRTAGFAEKSPQNPEANRPGEIRLAWLQAIPPHSFEEAKSHGGPAENLGGTPDSRHHGQLHRGID